MKRISRISLTSRPALLGAVVMLTLTSASVAAADDGRGPLGVTADVVVSRQAARVGALFGADRADSLSGGHFCTASVVHSPQGDLIATAAHCVSDTGTDLVFVPGYRDGKAPYGVWKLGHRYLPDGWAKEQDEDSDLAFATVDDVDDRPIEDVVGANRFTTGTATGATAVTVTGYPDSREAPISCTNKPTAHSKTQQRIDCPAFTSGTSGSPWINGDGQVVGILGGHEEGGDTDDVSYSVALGRAAADLYKDATAEP
ncbi:trypsin-like peptidase domain-containing protein [Streptomyces sp. NPDC001118]|uniref:trypsin-like peptidase domain-containing protein n=1 Tax=unclassified Streptomyces TaxID=2593676 RepID=UPI003316CB8E